MGTYISAIRLLEASRSDEFKKNNKSICLQLHILSWDCIHPKHLSHLLLPLITMCRKKELYRTCAYLIRQFFELLKNESKKLNPKLKGFVPKLKKLLKKC